MDYMIGNTEGAKYIYWGKSNGFRIYFTPNNIRATTSSNATLAEGATIENGADTWHHIKVKCDFPNNMYTLYLDNSEEPYIEWPADEGASLQQIVVRIEDDRPSPDAEPGYFAFDNVRLYDPEIIPTPEMEEIAMYQKVYIPTNIPDEEAIKEIKTRTFTDAVDTYYEYPTYILNKYGLMKGETETTFGVDKNITAGEFIDIVKKAYGVSEIKTPVYAQIAADPSKTITELQAAAVILSILGYDDEAEAAGGYPAGYRHVGNEICVSRGLNIYDSDIATRGIVAALIYNSMGTEIRSTGKSLFDMIRPQIAPALTDKDLVYVLQDNYYYRVEAYRVFMRKGITPEQITNDLVKILETGTTEQKKRAARALSDNQEPNSFFALSSKMATSNLLKVMKDENANVGVRIYALRAIWMMNIEELIPIDCWYLALYPETLEYSYTLLNKASDRLEMVNTDEDVQALIKALSCSDRDVVIRVIDTLNRKAINPDLADKARAAIPALKALVSSNDDVIAHQAAVALRSFGEEITVPEITRAHKYLETNEPVKLIKEDGKYTIDNGRSRSKLGSYARHNAKHPHTERHQLETARQRLEQQSKRTQRYNRNRGCC